MLSPFRRCLSTYVLGSEARELSRLGIQHGVFAGRTRDLYQSLNVQPGDSVIDLGCGPGFTTLELAQIVGSSGTVFAMDSSLTSLQVLSKRAEREGWIATSFCRLEHQDFGAIVLCSGNATKPETWRMFQETPVDKIFCRWLLTWLGHSDVARIHDYMTICTKPNGKVGVFDYFNVATFDVVSHNANGAPRWHHLRDVLLNEWNHVGNPSVCSTVPSHLSDRGFNICELRPLAPIVRPFDSMWVWPTTYFHTQARRLVETGIIQDEKFVEEFDIEWELVSKDKAAWYCPPMMATVVGQKQ